MQALAPEATKNSKLASAFEAKEGGKMAVFLNVPTGGFSLRI